MLENTPKNTKHADTANSAGRLGYSVKEACHLLGCSESHGWKLLRNGQIKGVSLGRRTIIPASEIERVLAGESA
jgi:excisionase family DNA binding protein